MINNKVKSELIEIESIRMIHSNISTDENYKDMPQPISEIEVKYKQDSAFNTEENKIRIRLNTSLEGLDKNKEKLGVSGNFIIEFHVSVGNFDDFVVVNEDGEKKVSDVLGNTLMGIVYSTARGIIFTYLQGTYLSGSILPVIDPSTLTHKKNSDANKYKHL
ncbi:MAG: hypothetical protein ACOC4B_00025 [Bacteroidota bacterium]